MVNDDIGINENTGNPNSTKDLTYCEACTLIDGLDGLVDGHHGEPPGLRAQHQRSAIATLLRAQGQLADRITNFAGSMKFVYIHIGWFAVWIGVNAGLAGVGHEFDAFPFGFLTLVVSLEAIFLATFVMISQNRQAAHTEARTQLDFENNIRSEIWSIHIGHALGINTAHVEATVAEAIRLSTAQLADRR